MRPKREISITQIRSTLLLFTNSSNSTISVRSSSFLAPLTLLANTRTIFHPVLWCRQFLHLTVVILRIGANPTQKNNIHRYYK